MSVEHTTGSTESEPRRAFAPPADRADHGLHTEIFLTAPEAIVVVDRNALIVDCNPEAVRRSGFGSRRELLSQTLWSLIEFEGRDAGIAAWNRILDSENVDDVQVRLATAPTEQFDHAMSARPLRSGPEGLRYACISLHDITARKRVEAALIQASSELEARYAELSESYDELERQSRALERSNEELEQFAYIASHDLKEPLRTVTNYVELLRHRYRGKVLDERGEHYIDRAVAAAERMTSLITDLLVLSRVESRGREFETVDSQQVVDTVLADYSKAIEESGATIVTEDLPAVVADPSQLRQLLSNLIGNAIKYRDERSPMITVAAQRKGGEVEFTVADNGIGFDQQFADRAFQPFKRLHSRRKYSGSGIGLPLCKKIVERHGGRIWAESEEGRGSSFHFTLPQNPQATQ